VVAPSGEAPPGRVEVRRVEEAGEFLAVEAVIREAWGPGSEPAVPASLQRAMQDNGGLVLGAYDGARLVGFTLGFLGRENGALFLYSHMTAVRPDAQDQRVGRALKRAQREAALAMGLLEVRWTFDPMQSRNAHFNVRTLGGVPDRYLVRYYGEMRDALNAGLETDRLRLVWELRAPRVADRLDGATPSDAEDRRRWEGAQSLVDSVPGPHGTRRPLAVRAPTDPTAHLEIPHDLAGVRGLGSETLVAWRTATRAAFVAAFEAGYRVDDFVVLRDGAEARSFYLLSRLPGGGEKGP
jgi:predicted GNAT superfamily acetyltransferase